ncbi:MAG TPA: hypothetical protein VK435_10690 [Thermodesulfovibrionales bacterium]|nr:hypothetical protein [Thermodesulfovibrionales bacterium]
MDKKKNIGELLIEYGKITREDLEEGLSLQKGYGLRIGETLIKLGKVTADDIEWVLSKQLDIPFVIVENVSLDPKLIYKFSRDLLLRHRILPLYETDEEIAVATDDPLNKDILGSIEDYVNKKIRLSSGNGEKIVEILTHLFTREGIPALRSVIERVLAIMDGTCFYRIDFFLDGYSCEISIFGFGILRKIEILSSSYTREQILEAFDSLRMAFVYDICQKRDSLFMSVYPLINRIQDNNLPAIIGTFGFSLPEGIVFTDAHVNRVPLFFSSAAPVSGYPFLSTKAAVVHHRKTIFPIDSAPEDFSDYYLHLSIPEPCGSCGGKGCTKCNELGLVFPRKLEGIYSSEELKRVLAEVEKWQK